MKSRTLLLAVVILMASCNRLSGRDDNGRTRLMRAAQSGDVESVRRLARNSSINDQVKGHSSLRQFSALIRWMQELPERRVGWTALMFAIDSSRTQVVQELLERGADAKLGPPHTTPLSLALRPRADTLIIKALLAHGASARAEKNPPLFQAITLRDTTIVRLLLAAGAAADHGQGEPPLVTAVKLKQETIVDQLLRARADVNARDAELGWTPLGWAIALKQDAIADKLRAAGADRAPEIDHALLNAVASGNIGEVKRLLASGANPNMTDERKRTAVSLAIDAKREDIAFVLLEAGAQVPAPARSGLLFTAAWHGADSMVSTLIRLGEKPGHHHLGTAAAAGHVSTVQLLLKAGADPNGDAGSPLRNAIRGDNAEVVRALIQAGADVQRDVRGESPLFQAVVTRRTQATRALLEAGADARKAHWLPMIYTPIVYNDTVTAALLLKHGADINATDSKGMTTLDHAMRLNKPAEIIRFLERHGAKGTSR